MCVFSSFVLSETWLFPKTACWALFFKRPFPWLTGDLGKRVPITSRPLFCHCRHPQICTGWLVLSLQHSLCSPFSLCAFGLTSVFVTKIPTAFSHYAWFPLPPATSKSILLAPLRPPFVVPGDQHLSSIYPLATLDHNPRACSALLVFGTPRSHLLCWTYSYLLLCLFFFMNLCCLVPVPPAISWLLSWDPVVSRFRTTFFMCLALPKLLWVTGSVPFSLCLQGDYRPVIVNSHTQIQYTQIMPHSL